MAASSAIRTGNVESTSELFLDSVVLGHKLVWSLGVSNDSSLIIGSMLLVAHMKQEDRLSTLQQRA